MPAFNETSVVAAASNSGLLFGSSGSTALVDVGAAELDLYQLALPVDIAGAGHALDLAWDGVPGATGVEVTDAGVTLWPAVVETVLPDAPATADGAGWRLDVPAGGRVRALGLKGFKDGDGNAITDSVPGGRRITVAFPPATGGGFDTPRYAVPAVGRRGAVPATLTGASLAHGTLTLQPAVAARRLRLALVDGGTPTEFADAASTLDAVQLVTHTAARDAQLQGPGGQVLWQQAEFDPDGPQSVVDLKAPLQAAFTQALAAQQPLQAHFTLKATAPAQASITGLHAHGAVLRAHAGIATTVLQGDPLALAVFDGDTLAAETPAAVSADLTLRYDGLRLLDEASDALPAPGTPVQGRIVAGGASAVRAWPAAALVGQAPARIGLVGRAPEACELALEWVTLHGETVGAALGPPTLLKLDAASGGVQTHWATVAKPQSLPRDAALRVRCNVGRFFWVGSDETTGLVRLAVLDPDPGGRPLLLAGSTLAELHDAELHLQAYAFPPAAFRDRIPLLQSSLFLHVDVSDLTLRYSR